MRFDPIIQAIKDESYYIAACYHKDCDGEHYFIGVLPDGDEMWRCDKCLRALYTSPLE